MGGLHCCLSPFWRLTGKSGISHPPPERGKWGGGVPHRAVSLFVKGVTFLSLEVNAAGAEGQPRSACILGRDAARTSLCHEGLTRSTTVAGVPLCASSVLGAGEQICMAPPSGRDPPGTAGGGGQDRGPVGTVGPVLGGQETQTQESSRAASSPGDGSAETPGTR